MVIARISGSGNACIFVDERGFMFVIGREQLINFLENGEPYAFRALSLIPSRTDRNYYPSSTVYTDEGNMLLKDAVDEGYLTDSFAESVNPKFREEAEKEKVKNSDKSEKAVSDVSIDW